MREGRRRKFLEHWTKTVKQGLVGQKFTRTFSSSDGITKYSQADQKMMIAASIMNYERQAIYV